ncbi:MAG: PH domain-containing protein [Pseudomonadota bacterium]
MAVQSEGGITTLTPTAWKWFVGAAVIFFLIPPFSVLISLVFVLTGAGVLQRLTLSPDGLKVRNWWSTKTYAWREIDDFRIHKVKSGLFTAANMVSFSHIDKQDTMMGKAAKLLVGGTHSVPAVGMKPQKLIRLMQAYKLGFAPNAAQSATASRSVETPVSVEAPVLAQPRQPTANSRPRAVSATPRAQAKSVSATPKTFAKPRKSTPLVQEGGGVFGRRRSTSPFQS